MEAPKGKTDWTKIAIGAGITFGVVVLALAAYDLGIKPMLAEKKATKEEKKA